MKNYRHSWRTDPKHYFEGQKEVLTSFHCLYFSLKTKIDQNKPSQPLFRVFSTVSLSHFMVVRVYDNE